MATRRVPALCYYSHEVCIIQYLPSKYTCFPSSSCCKVQSKGEAHGFVSNIGIPPRTSQELELFSYELAPLFMSILYRYSYALKRVSWHLLSYLTNAYWHLYLSSLRMNWIWLLCGEKKGQPLNFQKYWCIYCYSNQNVTFTGACTQSGLAQARKIKIFDQNCLLNIILSE